MVNTFASFVVFVIVFFFTFPPCCSSSPFLTLLGLRVVTRDCLWHIVTFTFSFERTSGTGTWRLVFGVVRMAHSAIVWGSVFSFSLSKNYFSTPPLPHPQPTVLTWPHAHCVTTARTAGDGNWTRKRFKLVTCTMCASMNWWWWRWWLWCRINGWMDSRSVFIFSLLVWIQLVNGKCICWLLRWSFINLLQTCKVSFQQSTCVIGIYGLFRLIHEFFNVRHSRWHA